MGKVEFYCYVLPDLKRIIEREDFYYHYQLVEWCRLNNPYYGVILRDDEACRAVSLILEERREAADGYRDLEHLCWLEEEA